MINNCIYDNHAGNGYGGEGGTGGWGYEWIWTTEGYGGPGGDGSGGYGYAIFSEDDCLNNIENCTITQHYLISIGEGGQGGPSGNWGTLAQSGLGTNGSTVITGNTLTIQNSIVWDSADPSISSGTTISYSCIEGGFPGTGNIDSDPLFVEAGRDDFHLQSTVGSYHGGQWLPDPGYSPCIDSGNPETAYRNEPWPHGYRVNMGAFGNTEEASYSTELGIPEEKEEMPLDFCLYPNYPNPFNAETTIKYAIPVADKVRLSVFDASGRQVAVLTDGWREAGSHEVPFDASDLSSGVYVYQLIAGEFKAIGKMVFMK
jgi:hypothetical protein